MKVPEIIERRRSMDCFAGAAELPSNPEKITPRSSFGKILLSSKDGVRDDKVGSLNLFTIAQCPRCQLGIALNRARSDQSQIVGFVV